MSKKPVANLIPLQEYETSATLTLPDGRKLGYAQYGSRSGRPIIVHHGMVLIGLGLSSSQPSRTLLDFAKDVEYLTEHLKLDDYSVSWEIVVDCSREYQEVVHLACAFALPATKLKAVAMFVALGPPAIGMKGARLINRIGYPYGFHYCPSFLNRWFWQRDPIAWIDLSDEERLQMVLDQAEKSKASMSEGDREAMKDLDLWRLAPQSTREGFPQGYDAVLVDGRLCCLDFGFKVEDFRSDLPVQL